MDQGADLLGRWGYLGIFLSVVLGNVGLPIPEDAVHLAAGYLAAAGRLDLPTVFTVGVLSVMASDHAGYWGARLLGRRGQSDGRRSALASRLAGALETYGPLGVFAARFVPVVRSLTGPIAGLIGVPPLQFLAANGSAAAIHVALLTGIGYALGARVEPRALASALGPAAGLAAGSALCLLLVLALRRRRLASAASAMEGLEGDDA
jgi:membrane protein DedA with SNARE-associated domain